MERIRRIMWTARHHQRWEGRQGEIGDQGLSDCRRMANSIPENITIRVRTDGTWRKWIATDTGLCDIGSPKLPRDVRLLQSCDPHFARVVRYPLEVGRDIEPPDLDWDCSFELL